MPVTAAPRDTAPRRGATGEVRRSHTFGASVEAFSGAERREATAGWREVRRPDTGRICAETHCRWTHSAQASDLDEMDNMITWRVASAVGQEIGILMYPDVSRMQGKGQTLPSDKMNL